MPYIFKQFRFWFFILFVGISIYFGVNNQDAISIAVFPAQGVHWSAPAYQIHFGFFALGACLAALFFGLDYMKKTMALRKANKQLKSLVATPAPTVSTPSSSAENTAAARQEPRL